MERPEPNAEGSAYWTLPVWAWLLGIALLMTWHGWLTLSLFGGDPWHSLADERPIITGRHPQHLYLANLGLKAFWQSGSPTAYDKNFQAGIPKTPIFDGARLAEVMLLAGGGAYQAAAYKIGFASFCLLAPFCILLACKTLDLGNGTSLLATLLGLLIWWGPHGRTAMMSGDCGLYFAALVGLAHVGFMIAFHRAPSVRGWFGLCLTAGVCWFLQPLLFPIALPVLLTYYLSVGVKHDFLTWHFAFWGAEILGIALNVPWLIEWVDSWWLRTPLPTATDLLAHRTLVTIWNAPLWGGPTSRILAVFVIASAAVGVVILNQTRHRPAARLLGISSTGALVLALLGISWEPLGVVGTSVLLAPSLWFAAVPAAHGWIWIGERLWRRGMMGRASLAGLLAATAAGFVLLADSPQTLLERCLPGEAFEIGLGPRREALVQALLQHTSDDARILWEDRKRNRHASRWPALLPTLTERSFIGGLDPDGYIVHSSIGLIDQSLDRVPIATWTDDVLDDYCRRYNVRWIVAWSPEVIERLGKWKEAEKTTKLVDEEVGWLFEVKRIPRFALRGHAEFLESDATSIRLVNVRPRNGEVVLSLHFQTGMRASPGRVQIESATSGYDPIGFIRLKLADPASRVTITWDR